MLKTQSYECYVCSAVDGLPAEVVTEIVIKAGALARSLKAKIIAQGTMQPGQPGEITSYGQVQHDPNTHNDVVFQHFVKAFVQGKEIGDNAAYDKLLENVSVIALENAGVSQPEQEQTVLGHKATAA